MGALGRRRLTSRCAAIWGHVLSPVAWTEKVDLSQTRAVATASLDIWREVRRLRIEFADEIAGLSADQWNTPSWCAGWRVRDVLGHLVSMRETKHSSLLWEIIRDGFRPDRAVDRLARATGDQPVPALVERLRLTADRPVAGLPPELALGDLLVHSADALRPCGLMPDPPAADVVVVLETYKKWGRRMFHTVPHRGLSLSATDIDWRSGVGPEVRGRAIDLLLLVANRRQVLEQLEGPGVATLDP
jgi:uncharacterized protein (TIGR03083 family)